MLNLALFRNSTFSGANVSMLLVALAMFGVFFYVSLYVQQILGYSPVEAGASFLPATVLIAVLSPNVGRLVDRVGSRWLTGARDDVCSRSRSCSSRGSARRPATGTSSPGSC